MGRHQDWSIRQGATAERHGIRSDQSRAPDLCIHSAVVAKTLRRELHPVSECRECAAGRGKTMIVAQPRQYECSVHRVSCAGRLEVR